MSTLTSAFQIEAEMIHSDHSLLRRELTGLRQALNHLNTSADPFVNLATTKQVVAYARHLAGYLPGHFQREEKSLLQTVADVSPELRRFAAQMQREHADLSVSLHAFLETAEQLGQDLPGEAAVPRVQEAGAALVRDLERHVALEEKELEGFL